MSKGNFACPACGSTSTYVRKRDGKVCCKTRGHGICRHRDTVQHECPLCRSKQVYYRSKTGTYACRRCGLGQDDGIPPEGEEKRYYPILVPDDLPPVDEVQISFDGGKTVWVFVASHPTPGGDE